MRSRLSIILVAALLAGLALLWLAGPKQRRETGQAPQADSVPPALTTEQVAGMSETNSGLRSSRLSNPIRPESSFLYNLWKRPITFYGKVIGQDDNPVDKVDVHFAWTDTSPNGRSETNSWTDTNGLFQLSGVTGRMLSVDVNKPGYYKFKDNQTGFDYGSEYQSDPANPVIFQVRKRGPGADLVTSRYGVSPDFPISAPRDGSPVRVDLLERKVGAEGSLRISQLKPAYEQWKTASNWSVKMEIPEGGFVEAHEEFPFMAPENGYLPEVEFQFQKGQTNWSEDLVKDFYIAFGNPRRYGHLHIETSILSGVAHLTYIINPDGSRDLEPRESNPSPRRVPPPGVREVFPH
jgi:hypothetical protein